MTPQQGRDVEHHILSRQTRQLILVVSGGIFFLLSLFYMVPTRIQSAEENAFNKSTSQGKVNNNKPEFTCPVHVAKALNVDPDTFQEEYTKKSEDIIHKDISEFVHVFRDKEFDGWAKTYNEVKSAMRDWKLKKFATNLKNNDNIFESACGIGLNLVMTLELVQAVKPTLHNITVYGNEWVPESVAAANNFLDALLLPLNASKGTICQGDSTNLDFVPSNAFDLVFTGYISTLLDPLDYNLGTDANYEKYDEICKRRGYDPAAKKLANLMQKRQNDWFGKWVSEMVRIAKPGTPVIVEQVSKPYCTDMTDWGGVDTDFWWTGIKNYGWDIDPTSAETLPDHVFDYRYDVFMRKN